MSQEDVAHLRDVHRSNRLLARTGQIINIKQGTLAQQFDKQGLHEEAEEAREVGRRAHAVAVRSHTRVLVSERVMRQRGVDDSQFESEHSRE